MSNHYVVYLQLIYCMSAVIENSKKYKKEIKTENVKMFI